MAAAGLGSLGFDQLTIRTDANNITDFDSFQSEFEAVFGFPAFHGRNMNAWMDGMGDQDCPGSGMPTVHAEVAQVLPLVIDNAKAFKDRALRFSRRWLSAPHSLTGGGAWRQAEHRCWHLHCARRR